MSDLTEHRSFDPPEPANGKRVLHVVVGHGLRTYFLNTVRSVRATASDDEILVVDNDSPDPQLRDDLESLAKADPKMRVLLRDSNSLVNAKVGGLYDAYREAFDIAVHDGFDYVHLVQGDMQMLWWDAEVLARADEIFSLNADCVNIYTCLILRGREDDLTLEESNTGQLTKWRDFGLLDLGIYDLHRWKELGVSFGNDELEHGKRYAEAGLSVICHPWPTVCPVPWPAVIRKGRQLGKEVRLVKPFILKPMTAGDVQQLKARTWTWMEDVCIPWGWTCLTPMWATDVSVDYLANRRHDAKNGGLKQGIPHWERRGLDNTSWSALLSSQHRPSIGQLFAVVPSKELLTRLKKRIRGAQ